MPRDRLDASEAQDKNRPQDRNAGDSSVAATNLALLIKLAQLLVNLLICGVGYWTLSLPPDLARLTKVCALVGIVTCALGTYTYRDRLHQLTSGLIRQPIRLTFLALITFGLARFVSNLFDEYPPSRVYAPFADLSIASLYSASLCCLAIACFMLVAKTGRGGESIATTLSEITNEIAEEKHRD